jgi:hypothetical protein
MVEPSSTSGLVDEPLDLYMVYLWIHPEGRFGNGKLGLSDDPFMFEFYAVDARHAMEQFMNDDGLLASEIDLERIEIKRVDPFYNEDLTNDR